VSDFDSVQDKYCTVRVGGLTCYFIRKRAQIATAVSKAWICMLSSLVDR
jgi:hypothetical protein